MTTPTTDQLIQWDRQFLWHPFTPMKPWLEAKDVVIIDRGQREFLIDTQGRRYIDASSSIWCNVHGHCVPELDAAVRDQLAKIAHSTLLGLGNVPSILLAKRLVELMRARGIALEKVFYSDDGSTAVEVACKLAYQYWRNVQTPSPNPDARIPIPEEWRSRFIAFGNAYHGDTLGAVSLGGIPTFHAAFKDLCFPVDCVPTPTATNDYAAHVEALLNAHPHRYAAIIIEPLVQGAGGMLMHPPGVMRTLRQLADRHDTLLIFDEVMTAFGRTGTMFACEREAVTPDLICLSKGLTAGYMPLGATMTTQKIFDAFYADPRQGKTFFHGHTFTGHPLACAVALASLDLFASTNLLAHVQKMGALMEELLAPAARIPHVANLRRRGMIAALDLVPSPGQTFPPHWRIGGALCTAMRDRGVMLRPLADTLVIMPPLAIREEHLRTLCRVVLESLPLLPQLIADKKREFATG